jgi:MFS family permease
VSDNYEQYIARNERWNFTVNLIDSALFVFGLSLVARDTVLPMLINKLTPSPLAVGAANALYNIGLYLPQLLGAGLSQRLARKKPYVTTIGLFGERIPYLLSAIAVFLLAENHPILTLVIIIACMFMASASAGLGIPAWYDMIAKIIPVRRRGLFAGLGNGIGAFMGLLGAGALAFTLERFSYPNNFGVLYLMAFVAMFLSWSGQMLTREPANPNPTKHTPLREYLRQLPSVLRNDKPFVRYLITIMLVRFGTMASGFLTLYGIATFGISENDLGPLTAILIGSQAVVTPICGWLGDRYGHKVPLTIGAFVFTLVPLAALYGTWISLLLAFLLLGIFISTDASSSLTVIPEFCDEHMRGTYIGLANTLLVPVITLSPIIGALLAKWGYEPLFMISAGLSLIGALLMLFWVRDPRHRQVEPSA